MDVIEYLGADTFVIVSCGEDRQVTVRVAGTTDLAPGREIGLRFDEARMLFLNAEGQSV